MSDKVCMEFSPYAGPDALREFARLMNNLYELHTKKNCGYEDINGSQYEGTVENWGSESLMETRKILLDKPSLKNIFIENTMDFYFDIDYSKFTNTYDQENMLCGFLRKDVLLSNKSYVIKFENVSIVNIPRAKSSSDPDVYLDTFICTSTPPTLEITDENNVVTEVPLKLTDIDGSVTNYYFHIDNETSDMYDDTLYPSTELITYPLTDSMYGRACIWMTVDLLRTSPIVNITGNELFNKTVMTIGTDGHDRSFLYPFINYEEGDINLNNTVIKVIPVDEEMFDTDPTNPLNYSAKIKEIHVLVYEGAPVIGIQPGTEIVLTYDTTYVKMSLAKLDDIISWNFRIPTEEDYDYDPEDNRCYAWTYCGCFSQNLISDEINKLIQVFRINYSDKYLSIYEGICENAYSGIHVDVTSDHSDNGVSKKNGVIHNLGDFDGLPPYFKYMLDSTIHRAHIELYAIRDKLNQRNQTAMDKQTAGIIIDSSVPQNDIQKVYDGMSVVIKFDTDNPVERIYSYDPNDPSVSKLNNLSEITYATPYRFGNSNVPGYQNADKFVYHGNRRFSLGVIKFDPELQTGRVYLISNDDAKYENNALTRKPKAPLTFARICDIPTEFAQLTSIHGVAPTVVIDPEYVRTEVDFSNYDKNSVYNLDTKDHILRYRNSAGDFFVWPSYISMNSHIVMNELAHAYPKYINLNRMIDLCDIANVSYDIVNQGSGYDVDDEFLMYIGGISIRGRVKTVDMGQVETFVFLYYDNETESMVESPIPILSYSLTARSNLKTKTSVYETNTTAGTGSGLTIGLTVDDTYWDSTTMTTSNYLNDVIAFQEDSYNNIWVWRYDNTTETFIKIEQLTGAIVHENVNDSGKNVDSYKFSNVYLNNFIKPISNEIDEETLNVLSSISRVQKSESIDITSDDLSAYINSDNKNEQNALFVFVDGDVSSFYDRIVSFEMGHVVSDQETMAVQVYSDLNLPTYTNKTNKMRYHNNENTQPSLYLFDPTLTTVDTYTSISKDIVKLNRSIPISLNDIFAAYTGTSTIVAPDGTLCRNVYIYDEFTTTDMVEKRSLLETMSRIQLIEMLREQIPGALALSYEGTPYEYTKEMLIDYFIQNTLYWGREAHYTDGDQSIYRRPEVKVFREKNEMIVDNRGNPVGAQPTGGFKEISNEIFDANMRIDNTNVESNPLFVFRIDDDSIDTNNLDGFRLYDESDSDISEISVLIINEVLYAAQVEDDNIRWVEVNRPNTEE